MNKKIKKQVKELSDMGFDDDIIMASLQLSQEEYEDIKAANKKTVSSKKSKLQFVRERYHALYNKESQAPIIKEKTISDEDRKIAEGIIEDIRAEFIDVEKLKTLNFSAINQRFLPKFEKIDRFDLPLDLIERLYTAFPENSTLYSVRNRTGNVRSRIYNKRSEYQRNYINALSQKVDSTDDIEELETIFKKVYTNLDSVNYMTKSIIQSKVLRKLSQAKQKMYTSSNRISEKCKKMAASVMSEEYDEDVINKEIDEEAKVQFESKKRELENNKQKGMAMSLRMPTIESTRNMVIHQITKVIREGGHIYDPEEVLERITRLNNSRERAFDIVLSNLIANERFDEANAFVEKNVHADDAIEGSRPKKIFLSRIKRAEIASFILKGINAEEGDYTAENKYYDMIEEGLAKAKISPSAIVLGKTKNGEKNITWDDVMEKKRKQEIASREF